MLLRNTTMLLWNTMMLPRSITAATASAALQDASTVGSNRREEALCADLDP